MYKITNGKDEFKYRTLPLYYLENYLSDEEIEYIENHLENNNSITFKGITIERCLIYEISPKPFEDEDELIFIEEMTEREAMFFKLINRNKCYVREYKDDFNNN